MDYRHISWNQQTYETFLLAISAEADASYKIFNESLLASQLPTIGLRLPFLRKTAKEISKGDKTAFLSVCQNTTHEERLLYGMVAAFLPYDEFLPYSDHYAEYLVENWALCDTFCTSLKKVLSKKEAKGHYFSHIKNYLSSQNPWAVRVGIIVMLAQYLEEDTIDEVLRRSTSITSEFYYVRMAQAWLFATSWAKFPEKTKNFLAHTKLDPWTFRKFVQKARESYRVSPEDKAYLKSLLSANKS